MLLLKPKHQTREVVHADSGAKFFIRPLQAARREAVRAKHKRGDEVRLVPFMEELAKSVIADWENVGDENGAVPCTEESRAEFGRSHALTIMPWLLGEAESLDQFLSDERATAKNA